MRAGPWRNRDHIEFISYCDMSFGAVSIFLSIIMFTKSLPPVREGNELAHDLSTVIFMGSVLIHFIQLFQAVRLLNSTENQNEPPEAIRLVNSWLNWCLFFLLLLVGKFYVVLLCFGKSFWFILYMLFIGLEMCYRLHSRYYVKEFKFQIEIAFPEEHRYYSPYLWNQ